MHPYIRVNYTLTEIPRTYGIVITYCGVQVVIPGEKPKEYNTGRYAADLTRAQMESRIFDNVENDPSVAMYEKLVAAKPEERYKIVSGKITP